MWKRLLIICTCALTVTACAREKESISEKVEVTVAHTMEESVVEETFISVEEIDLEEDVTATEEVVAEEGMTVEDISVKEDVFPQNSYDFTICFAGDINLDEAWCTTQFLDQQPNGITDCISGDLLAHMNAADVMCLNNEFTYSLSGEPLADKLYTFRANPERVSVLQEMGVDVVKLANNHVYDYGKQALLDTFDTLEGAGIAYVGAGRNLAQAMEPVYIELDGKIIAFVAASRAEKFKMTPQATEDSPGILRCYDTELFLETIKKADANADFVLAYVHWGTEYSYELEDVQMTTGREYLDAGADVVIGAHSHCLQGMEFYDEKPIIYSLGNYWFNEKTLDTMLLDLHFYGDDTAQNLEVRVIPAIQSGYRTQGIADIEEQERIYSFLEDISINVEINQDGIVQERK